MLAAYIGGRFLLESFSMRFSLMPSLRGLSLSLLALVCSLALALPSPKDITAAVESGDLARAETLLQEVL